MRNTIVSVTERPEFANIVAEWMLRAFGTDIIRSEKALCADLRRPLSTLDRTFLLLDDDTPIATASLSREDALAYPAQTPWLAGVYVKEDCRNKRYATAIIRHVEDFAASNGAKEIWLYTKTAADLYRKLGWSAVGSRSTFYKNAVLMHRQLCP